MTSYPSVARVVSQLDGRQLPVSPPMNRSTLGVPFGEELGGDEVPAPIDVLRIPLASPLPVMVSKLLSFWTNRVSLEV